MKNSHYTQLTDADGNALKLVPIGLICGKCDPCDLTIYTPSNHGGLKCPTCNGEMKWEWGNLQLCFIPEEPSNFVPPIQKK